MEQQEKQPSSTINEAFDNNHLKGQNVWIILVDIN
jgi:hypothetical protein